LKVQAGAARQGRLTDFRILGSTERAFKSARSIDHLVEANQPFSRPVMERTVVLAFSLVAFAIA